MLRIPAWARMDVYRDLGSPEGGTWWRASCAVYTALVLLGFADDDATDLALARR
jgi:hypothetical protein